MSGSKSEPLTESSNEKITLGDTDKDDYFLYNPSTW